MQTYDVIVIGAGHNGLTAAAYLARRGQRVLVLERRSVVGGTAVTEEFAPGFRADSVFHRGNLRPEVIQELGLAGLEADPRSAPLAALQPGGGALVLTPGWNATAEAIGRFSRADARQWPHFYALMEKIAGLLQQVYRVTFPRLPRVDPSEASLLAQLGLKLRGLGKRDLPEVLRVLPMSLVELLDEWFESDALKGALGAQGVHGLTQGAMSAGTAYLLLHHWALQAGPFRPAPPGGVGAISQALARVAQAAGAEVRTGAEAVRVLLSAGRAAGVVLADGTELRTARVVSSLDPKRTLLGLVDPEAFDPEFLHAVGTIKMRGASARMHLALDGLPEFPGLELAQLKGTLVVSPSLLYLERAYDAAKYGGMSERPYLELVVPTLDDPGLAPPGRHVLSIHAQFAPYHLQGGWSDEKREALGDLVVDTLAEYAPDLKRRILHRQVLSPLDLEQIYGLTEGSLYHGEMMLDQILFMRPLPGWSQYRTPLDGLYLCGAGTHPGGGLSGLPGRNAALQLLRDLRRGA